MTSPEQGRDLSVHPLGSAERWNRMSTARRMGTALRGVVEDVVLHRAGRLDQMYADHMQATWMRMYRSMDPVEGAAPHAQASEAGQVPAEAPVPTPGEAPRPVPPQPAQVPAAEQQK